MEDFPLSVAAGLVLDYNKIKAASSSDDFAGSSAAFLQFGDSIIITNGIMCDLQ